MRKRKIIAALIACAMTTSNMSVFATMETPNILTEYVMQNENAELMEIYYCGEWQIYDKNDGTVGIYSYEGYESDVTIPSEIAGKCVSEIGDHVFFGDYHVTSVTISEGIEIIGDEAFYGSSHITNILLPSSIKEIGYRAFRGVKVEELTIPESVQSIGAEAFSGTNLKNIKLECPIETIEEDTFYNCDYLESVILPDTIKTIKTCAFARCKALKSIVIPDSVTEIGLHVFIECTSLESVKLSENINTISYDMFGECSSLVDIIIPQNVTTIEGLAFNNCSSLKKIEIPRNVISIGNNLGEEESVARSVFMGCSSLIEIKVAEDNPSFCSADNVLFDKEKKRLVCCGAGKAGQYEIPNGVEKIVENAFRDCNNITDIIIPKGITDIGEQAFKDCEKLSRVNIPNSIIKIGSDAFLNTAIYNDESNWENGVLYIYNYLIKSDDSIPENYSIKSGTIGIADSALEGNSTEIIIPDSVKFIGNYAFSDCYQLKNIIIPDSVEMVGEGAFLWCESLENIVLPSNLKYLGGGAFGGTAFAEDESNWDDNALYINNYLISAMEGLKGNYSIKKGTTYICDYVFSVCEGLTGIEIPKGVITIGEEAFYSCKGLTNITIPNSVTSIGKKAFYHCSGLISITIPESVTNIGQSTFSGCSENLVIYGKSGSYAETYAKENGIAFSAISDVNYGDVSIAENTDKPPMFSEENMTVEINVVIENINVKEEATVDLYVASYKNGVMTGISAVKAAVGADGGYNEDIIIEGLAEKPDYIKIFAFNGTDGVSPLCESAQNTVE